MGDGALACSGCWLSYRDPGWVDVHIPDDVWERINGREGGVLCLTCIARRLVAAGITGVPLMVTSGPFRHDPDLAYQRGYAAARDMMDADPASTAR